MVVDKTSLRFVRQSFLVDVGEATQHRLIRDSDVSPIHIGQIDTIFLTHLHGDHCFGIFGLLATLFAACSREAVITVCALKFSRYVSV